MTTVDVPTAVHIGADALGFVDIGEGCKLKVLQVKEVEGLWIVENVFPADYEVQRHKHTGPVSYMLCEAEGLPRPNVLVG